MARVDTFITDARYVITCDDQDVILERAGIAIDDGHIVAVGDITGFEADNVIDAVAASCCPAS